MARVGSMAGGGFNIAALITGFEFTHTFPGATREDAEKQVYGILHYKVDGADAPVSRVLRGGGGKFLEVAEDGKVLINPEGGNARLWDKSDLYRFVKSAVDAGFPDDRFSDDPTVIDFSPLVGTRVQLGTRQDEEAKEKGITRKLKGKDGAPDRAVTPSYLVVTKVHALPDGGAVSSSPSAKTGANAGANNDALAVEATGFLKALLTAQTNNVIEKSKLSIKVTQKCAADKVEPAKREALRKLITTDEFLKTGSGWSYDGSKVALAA